MKDSTRKHSFALSAALLAISCSLSAPASAEQNSASLFIGSIQLDEDDWGSQDSQDGIGLMFNLGAEEWPVSIALDVMGSGNEKKSGSKTDEFATASLFVGARKHFELSPDFEPYIGGGLLQVQVEVERSDSNTPANNQDYDDSGLGYWVGGGVNYLFGEQYHAGLDIRHSSVDVDINGQSRDAGGLQTALVLGYRF